MDKSYLRKLRIAMNPRNDTKRRERAKADIRKSMRMMLEAEKLETELYLNPKIMNSKEKLLLEKRFEQVMKEREKERKGQMGIGVMEDTEDQDDFRCPPCS